MSKPQSLTQQASKGEVVLYKNNLEVKLEHESVWLTQAQMGGVFSTERSVITKHIRNILNSKELVEDSVCAFFAHTAGDGKVYQTKYYNLDMIISVGYRVNSKRGTEFRIWATNILKQHLVQGYTLNQKRLKEHAASVKTLQEAVKLLANISARKTLTGDEAKGLFEVIRDYSYGLDILDDYDHGRTQFRSVTSKACYRLTYDESARLIEQMRRKFGGSNLFGNEKDGTFQSDLGAIYQTFDGKDLYPSVEEKAANLLYLVVKDHAFSDGNKRIAAALFVWFLDRNMILYKTDGSKRMADNALVAITLLIAESQPREKDVVTALVVNLINKFN